MDTHAQLVRKGVHALLGVIFALAGSLLGQGVVLVAASGLLCVFLFARSVRILTPSMHRHAVSQGALFFVVGVLLSAFAFLPEHPDAFVVGMLVLALADPLASLVGSAWGRHPYRILGELRTYEGSLTCLCVSGAVLLAFVGPTAALAGAVAVAGAEAVAPSGSDNVLLPLIAGACVAFL